MKTGNLYIIYYGWLVSGESGKPNEVAARIAAARPKAVVAPLFLAGSDAHNLSPDVREMLRAADVRVWGYVPTGYGNRPLSAVITDVVGYMANGLDGIFFDEVYHFRNGAMMGYYRVLFDVCKQFGGKVILNPGVADVGEMIMEVTDILTLEHQWRNFSRICRWRKRYEAERFMGNSSNEPGAAAFLGTTVDADTAVRETRDAWSGGIGWHYSTDRYTELPPWFAPYINETAGHVR